MSVYHTLAEWNDDLRTWSIQFGDHDREEVEAERDDMVEHGARRSHLRIFIAKSARQTDVDAGLARLARIATAR